MRWIWDYWPEALQVLLNLMVLSLSPALSPPLSLSCSFSLPLSHSCSLSPGSSASFHTFEKHAREVSGEQSELPELYWITLWSKNRHQPAIEIRWGDANMLCLKETNPPVSERPIIRKGLFVCLFFTLQVLLNTMQHQWIGSNRAPTVCSADGP